MAPRTPLLRPDRYFADRDPDLARGLAVAGLVTLAAVGLVAGLGAVFTAKIDGTALADAEGSFGNTLTVAAWGFAPSLVTIPLGVAALWFLMDPVTITPGTDPAVLESVVLNSIGPWMPAALVLNLATSVWASPSGRSDWNVGDRSHGALRLASPSSLWDCSS